jgi:predicted esterase
MCGSDVRSALVIVTGLALSSCPVRRADVGTVATDVSSPAPPASAGAEKTAPEAAAPEQAIDLAVEGFLSALVWAPHGTLPRPVVLATHGATDSPEPYCRFWREVVQERAFVVCTRGRPMKPEGYYYPDSAWMQREAALALSSLRQKFGSRVSQGPILYAGFSQGAIFGSPIVQAHPDEYPRAVLMEGGASGWNRALARQYRARGGRRVLFVCGEHPCAVHARATASVLNSASLATKVIAIEDVGHTYTPAIAREIQGLFGWLFEGDERWADLAR